MLKLSQSWLVLGPLGCSLYPFDASLEFLQPCALRPGPEYLPMCRKEVMMPTKEHCLEDLKRKSVFHLEALSNASSPFQLCPLHAINAICLTLT